MLEVWNQPYLATAALCDGPTTFIAVKEVALDYMGVLRHMIPHFQTVFNLGESNEFCIKYSDSLDPRDCAKARWLNTREPLSRQDVKDAGTLLVYPLKVLSKVSPASSMIFPELKGFRHFRKGEATSGKQKRSIMTKISQTKRKLVILSSNFLFVYSSEKDSTPSTIVALEYYSLKHDDDSIALSCDDESGSFFGKRHYIILCPEDAEEWADVIITHCVNYGLNKVFGVDLQRLAKKERKPCVIPRIVFDVLDYFAIDPSYLQTEGIFRVPGNMTSVEYLREQYDQGLNVSLQSIPDPHLVATLFKIYLRELPEPLFTFELFHCFTVLDNDVIDEQTRIKKITDLVAVLPIPNYVILKHLLLLLHKVQSYSETNKMTTANLARVFAPTIFRGPPTALVDADHVAQQTQSTIKVTETLIQAAHSILEEVEKRVPGLCEIWKAWKTGASLADARKGHFTKLVPDAKTTARVASALPPVPVPDASASPKQILPKPKPPLRSASSGAIAAGEATCGNTGLSSSGSRVRTGSSKSASRFPSRLPPLNPKQSSAPPRPKRKPSPTKMNATSPRRGLSPPWIRPSKSPPKAGPQTPPNTPIWQHADSRMSTRIPPARPKLPPNVSGFEKQSPHESPRAPVSPPTTSPRVAKAPQADPSSPRSRQVGLHLLRFIFFSSFLL